MDNYSPQNDDELGQYLYDFLPKIGQIVGKFMKGSMGGVLSFVLVILLVLPILLFSSFYITI